MFTQLTSLHPVHQPPLPRQINGFHPVQLASDVWEFEQSASCAPETLLHRHMPGLAAAHTSFARRYIVTATRHHKMAETSGGPQSNHGHEAFPSFAILTSYHVLSVDLPTQHLTDLKGSSSSPYKGRNVFLSKRGGCSAAESLRWLLFNLWFIPSLALRNNWLKNSSLLRTDLTNTVTRVCLPSLASGRK